MDEFKAIKNLGAVTTVCIIMDQIIYRHGCPQFIKSDKGTYFTSHIIPKLNKLLAIRGALTTSYHPEGNGCVEQVNQTIVNILRRMMTKKNSDWTSYLSTVAFAYNITKHSSTGYSPFELLNGCTASLPPVLYSRMDLFSSTSYKKYLENLICNIIEMQAKAFTSSYERKILLPKSFPQYSFSTI